MRHGSEFHRDLKMRNGTSPVYTCENREPLGDETSAGAFIPVLAAQVSEASPTATYEGRCFETIDFAFDKTSDTTFDVTVTTGKKKSMLCNDTILFGNTEIMHIEYFFLPGKHKLSFEMNTP